MHGFYRGAGISQLQSAQFVERHFPEIAMAPNEAVRALVKNRVDYVPLDETAGRIAATLRLVYPPGIATIIPGERFDEKAKATVGYLKAFEAACNRFPGFESEIQGLYREPSPIIRFYTYAVRE